MQRILPIVSPLLLAAALCTASACDVRTEDGLATREGMVPASPEVRLLGVEGYEIEPLVEEEATARIFPLDAEGRVLGQLDLEVLDGDRAVLTWIGDEDANVGELETVVDDVLHSMPRGATDDLLDPDTPVGYGGCVVCYRQYDGTTVCYVGTQHCPVA